MVIKAIEVREFLFSKQVRITAKIRLTGIAIVALIGIRQVTLRTNKRSRFAGSGNWKAYYVEATVLAVVFCVIALRGLEGALSDET